MFQNTKYLIIFSLLIIIAGISLLWFGLRPLQEEYTPGASTSIESEPTNGLLEGYTEGENLGSEYVADEPETSVSGLEGERALVTKVVDGDTIYVSVNGEKHTVRFLGVDTPETVDPRKSVQCFGKEASNKAKELLSDREVILQKDVSDTDMYKRWLRFIYLPLSDGSYLFVNDYLIREGYAKVLTIPPDVKFGDQFLDAQRQARENKKGLWGHC